MAGFYSRHLTMDLTFPPFRMRIICRSLLQHAINQFAQVYHNQPRPTCRSDQSTEREETTRCDWILNGWTAGGSHRYVSQRCLWKYRSQAYHWPVLYPDFVERYVNFSRITWI